VHRHSRGFPRLINTVCESALIAGYSKQAASLTPDLIDAIATDFRLGIQTTPSDRSKTPDELDLQKAARSLLQLYSHLQREQSQEGELRTRVSVRVGEHEPYI